MARVAVNAVRRHETDEVKRVFVALAPRHRVDKRRLLEEVAVANALVDARQVLIDDAAGAHRDVADLRVAHLPGGQADRLARGDERRMSEAIEQLEVGRRARQLDGVVSRSSRRPHPSSTTRTSGPVEFMNARASCRMARRPA